ncbi:MAG: lysine--tRNA ligase, partial [Burkholderiaceae bacterium]
MSDAPANPSPEIDENQLIAERRDKLRALRASGAVAFPNDFKPSHQAQWLHNTYHAESKEALEAKAVRVKVAGRMMLKRVMGKASFATLQDGSLGSSGGRIQIYL